MSTINCPNTDCQKQITDHFNYCPFCRIELKDYLPANPELIEIAKNWTENPRAFIKFQLGIDSLYHLNKIWDAVKFERCSLTQLLTFNRKELISIAKIGKKTSDKVLDARLNWNLDRD